MQDITDLYVTQIKIYQIDVIPFLHLTTATATTAVTNHFKFRQSNFAAVEGLPTLRFEGGEFKTESGTQAIVSLIIEPRRITTLLQGSSVEADAVFEDVRHLLITSDLYNRFSNSAPLLSSDETRCNVTLDIDQSRLISSELGGFLSKSSGTFSLLTAQARVQFLRLAFKVAYSPLEESLRQQDVALNDKELIIEPRLSSLPGEHRFFTSSPLRSEFHLKFLEQLEQVLRTS